MYLNKWIFTTYAHLVIAGRRMILSSAFIKTVNLENFTLFLIKLLPIASLPIKKEYETAVATGIEWQFNSSVESVSIARAIFCLSLL